MSETKGCPICGNASEHRYDGRLIISCPRCGEFKIGRLAASYSLKDFNPAQLANLSGWIREHQDCLLVSEDLERLSHLRVPDVGDKADKLLRWLSETHPKAGTQFEIFDGAVNSVNTDIDGKPRTLMRAKVKPEVLSRTWCQDEEEFIYVVLEYIIREKHLLEPVQGSNFYRITPTGWSHIHSLQQGNPHSQIGFIAMWFGESMSQAHLAIEAGIRSAGYKPFRVDQKEHNDDITDEIIAGIRGSKFLVADLTNHRNGVYYEAGFAKGLGLEVVWLCRKSDEEGRHFDIRQLSTIFWEEDKLAELSKALQNRIVATIGRGPLAEKI